MYTLSQLLESNQIGRCIRVVITELSSLLSLHVAEFVTVGWGKKETQFHGSEGKQAATKKEVVELGVMRTDDRKPRIR